MAVDRTRPPAERQRLGPAAGPDDWVATLPSHRNGRVSPGRVILELTETSPGPPDAGVTACVEEARAVGFGIWLDDFGTGWASL